MKIVCLYEYLRIMFRKHRSACKSRSRSTLEELTRCISVQPAACDPVQIISCFFDSAGSSALILYFQAAEHEYKSRNDAGTGGKEYNPQKGCIPPASPARCPFFMEIRFPFLFLLSLLPALPSPGTFPAKIVGVNAQSGWK